MSTDADAVDNNSSTNNATNKLINNAYYDESFLKHSPTTQNYDDAGVLTNNNYGIVANANQTNYDDPSVLSH
jgi:hypothetical protein